MSIAVEPGEELPILLNSEKSKPVDKRRIFFSPALTMRQQRVILRELDKLYDDTEEVTTEASGTEPTEPTKSDDKRFDSDKFFDRILVLLGKYLVRWENTGFEFSPAHFEDVFSSGQAIDLLRKIAGNQHVAPEEKKS